MNKVGLILMLFTGMILASCSVNKKVGLSAHDLDIKLDHNAALNSGFTGLALYDLDEGKTIYSRNAEKYFVPASNTKIFTLYTCLHTLKDSIPAFRYIETDSTFTFWGTADPTLMHPFFTDSGIIDLLKSKSKNKKMIYGDGHHSLSHFGPGWMWDDFNDYYQAELSTFPLYGNILYIKKDTNGIKICPAEIMVKSDKTNSVNTFKRDHNNNHFLYPERFDTLSIYEQELPYFDAEKSNIGSAEKVKQD